ncbi:MAG: 2-amino-4-hydroxy-6-hydroxymethyldihydropteridine diphosphokinase [Oculatellaceae cyanobacterium Prado106]|jgi:2-amino-4-hydroxy-6-hydroxymethyldihydropteridine diphosphokinase|nr:2-amino-4-hydroxy-6-hydroxymethyldihydropteridine diphosphokinase [Oculatellaceae cyanobacterium Prado106]
MNHRAAIALGSNLGNSHQILEDALKTLAHHPQVSLEACSPIYQTPAIGPPQPDYLNCCAIVSTSLEPEPFLALLLSIETQFGRERRERWGPRLLDLDLLLFDDLIIHLPGLQIPHPRMGDRAFVLVPLSDIAADWVDPVSGLAIVQLKHQVDTSGIQPFHPLHS